MKMEKDKRMTHLMITIMSNTFDRICPVSQDKNNYVKIQTSKV